MATSLAGRHILCISLLFHDLQDLHGASLDTDAAGDALGGRSVFGHDHDLHGAGFYALAAGGAQLLVDHVHTGLRILRNRTGFTGLHALTALNAGHGFCTATLCYDLNAGEVFIKLLVERHRTSADALQACHTLNIFLSRKSFHDERSPFQFYFLRTL